MARSRWCAKWIHLLVEVFVAAIVTLLSGLVGCRGVVDTMPPGTPSNMTMTETGVGCIVTQIGPYERWRYPAPFEIEGLKFTWDAFSDDRSGVASYKVRIDSDAFTYIGNVTDYHVTIDAISDGSHTFEVGAVDKAGNEGMPGSLAFTIDTTPPTIHEVGISNVTNTSASISWTTDEPAHGSVAYWAGKPTCLDTSAYGFAYAPQLSTEHTITLTGLEEGTTYHFQVKCIDEADNKAFFPVIFFTTPEE
jgi:hypothetical protein